MKVKKKRNIILLIFIVFVTLLLIKSFVGFEQEAFLKNKKEFITFSDKNWRSSDINLLLDNINGNYYCAEKQNFFQREIVMIGRLKQGFDVTRIFNPCDRREAWNFYIPPFVDLAKVKDVTRQLGISDVNEEHCGCYFVSHAMKSDPHYRQTLIEREGVLQQDGWRFTLSITGEREFCFYLKFR